MRRLIFPAILLLVLVGSVIGFWFFREQSSQANQEITRHTITVDGREREFYLVPPKRQPAQSHAEHSLFPVVIAFHGVGDDPMAMPNYSGLNQLAERDGFLVVYPRAVGFWRSNVDLEDSDDQQSQPFDLNFLDALIVQLVEHEAADPAHIYLVGMSSGATFAQYAATSRVDIAAVVAHSGSRPAERFESPTHFPLLLMAGDQDHRLEQIKQDAATYKQKGHQTKLVVLTGVGHEWPERSGKVVREWLLEHRKAN